MGEFSITTLGDFCITNDTDLALAEKCLMVLSEEGLVATFDLIDWHCQDLLCDCYKVNFAIVGSDKKTYATITYGWKPPSFYHKSGFDKRTAKQLTSGFLDPLAEQSRFADVFLEPFSMMIKDPNFIERINRRYAMFRKAIPADRRFSKMPDTIVCLKAG